MKIDILTLFPEMFVGPLTQSIIKRAQEKNLVKIKIHNLRDWADDKHKTVDSKPFGGGAGMLLRVDIIDKAISDLKSTNRDPTTTILLDAGGKTFTQKKAQSLSKNKHLILIAGHYEGIDHRVHKHIADEVISIGNYVLTGGELPAMVITDSIVRLIPNVIDPKSLKDESFSSSSSSTEYPQYTRPTAYKDWKVPDILLSGNHAKIKNWQTKNIKKND